MSRVTPESIERVRLAADMVEVVSAHTELRRRGARYLGLCPFHDERTPSFSVDPAEKLYYCFGCQAGGNIFTFLEEKEGLDFRDAVEQLADRYGVELEFEQGGRDDERRRARERLLELLSKTATFYARYLWDSAEAAGARKYLEGRGLGREVLEEFGVGYAPSAWDRVLVNAQKAGFTEQELQVAGLAQRGRQGGLYDRFRARIMFPLRDGRGRVLGFGARATRDNQQPKYVNTSESPVYRKGRQLFGLDLARSHITKQGRALVVEGYTDVLALHQAGFPNAVAAMGTALTEEQLGELARLAPEVLLAFDADRSGQEAMLRAQRAAAGRGLILKVVRLPDDKDPCDLLMEAGPDSFKTRVGAAIPFLEFQVTSALGDADALSAADKDRVVAELAPVFSAVRPSAERDEQIRHVADRLDLSEHLLAPLLARPTEGPPVRTTRLGDRAGASRVERNERMFLAICVSSGDRGRAYLERLVDEHLSSDVLRRARAWILEHFDSPTAGLGPHDEALMNAVSEIVVRASSAPASEHALEFGFLELEKYRLEREIRAATAAQDFDRHRRLSVERSRVTEAKARLMGSEEISPPTTEPAREHG
ncbi:MAG TPA: DNA primase [Solirubrobacterales bacterium]|nr:DNA primase [Solirubrobacterales bacterium]